MPTSSTQGMLTDTLRLSLDEAQNQVNTLLLGKEQEVRLAFVALLSGGHLLLEDLPGLGKTTLAHALASSLGLTFRRVQFTSDLLPADVLGISVYNTQTQQFEFHPGPVFTHVLLADEINRAPPRTQSALLEAMAEQQVTLADVILLRKTVLGVHVSDALIEYVQALLLRSRQQSGVRVGLSPRAGIALLRAAKAYALLSGREHVLPEDIQELFVSVAGHRLVPEAETSSTGAALAQTLLYTVPVD